MNKKIIVSRYRNSVQCSIPTSVLKDLGLLPGDELEFSIDKNIIKAQISKRVPLDKIDFGNALNNTKTKRVRKERAND